MKIFNIERLTLESAEVIDNINIAYQTTGEMNADKSNIVWVFHPISGDSDVFSWWPSLFGPNKLYNPEDHFIICANCMGSPYGSSHPIDFSFPQFTVRDIVHAYLKLAASLNISSIDTIIGGSFGGYQALEFAYSFQGSISHMILLASSSRESAWGIAVHEAQRMALQADTSFGQRGGGTAGLKAARALGVLTYRTSEILIRDQTDEIDVFDKFKASSYINYQGSKFSERFDPLCLYYLTKCIDSHNVGRERGGEIKALHKINIPTLVIGFNSDLLVPIESQRYLAQHLVDASFAEIDSTYGHDGFLLEGNKIQSAIESFYKEFANRSQQRTILKFGGSSLYGQNELKRLLEIVQLEFSKNPIAIVVSAMGNTTDRLLELYNLAKIGEDFSSSLQDFTLYANHHTFQVNITPELLELKDILQAIKILKSTSEKSRDKVLVFGELISAKIISGFLAKHNLHTELVDARDCLICDLIEGEYDVNTVTSRRATLKRFQSINKDSIPVITGFIASNQQGESITLGRNGSNFSASLFANFLHAAEVQNWTDVDGIYSADPQKVPGAVRIHTMNYDEANEMASFGMNLLHSKTILPLKQAKIPLRIKSSKFPAKEGTTINHDGDRKGIKAVTSITNIALITIEGNRLKRNIGIDARIFTSLQSKNINVQMISQASTENGIGFVVSAQDKDKALQSLKKEFRQDLTLGIISHISAKIDVGIVVIIGRHNFALEKAISALRRNEIWMYLISNSISGKNISLVVDKKHLEKAIALVHNEVYGMIKTLHVFTIGKGAVGSALIHQVLQTTHEVTTTRKVKINIIGVCDSKKYILNQKGISADWKRDLAQGIAYDDMSSITQKIKQLSLNNIVIVDNSASPEVSKYYDFFVSNNFDLVASNKLFNSGDISKYKKLRNTLELKGRKFLYETNVGAGLPILNLLKTLHQSSDTVYKIRGVLSGSLSYILNNFSTSNKPIYYHIQKAIELGYAEPDPRIDFSGVDVARKLIILAREIGFEASLEDVKIENLIPSHLLNVDFTEPFSENEQKLNFHYDEKRNALKDGEVLRYVAEINTRTKTIFVKLLTIDKSSALAQIKNADNYFEVYTNSYKKQPIIIQGKGAGPLVTAQGVHSDIIRIA